MCTYGGAGTTTISLVTTQSGTRIIEHGGELDGKRRCAPGEAGYAGNSSYVFSVCSLLVTGFLMMHDLSAVTECTKSLQLKMHC